MTAIEKRPLNAPDAVQPTGGYPQAVEVVGAKRLLFVSGQIPVHADGTLPKEFKEQARLAWANVEAQLRAAGMGLDNLVKVTIFLSDRAYNLENREVRRAVLGERPVALTVIITGIFDPAWLLEIEAVAAG
jgi:2-iminobutanoate/2-iminopropanoate deaminase